MKQSKAFMLRVPVFWIGAAVLYGFVFLIHNHVYVTRDAIPTSAGLVVACYVGGWALWYTANRIWGPERVPSQLFATTVLAYLFAIGNCWPLILKLLA